MPIFTYPNKIIFRNNKEEGAKEKADENVDFALKMRDAIDVQLIDTNLYMSKELWLPFGSRGAFGGQIVAQALKSAWETVHQDFFVHSLHSYFILACNVDIPVIYNVQRIRDGRSFATRILCKARRRNIAKPPGMCETYKCMHTDMPDVVDADSLPSDIELLQHTLANTENDFPEKFRQRAKKRLEDDQPIDYRAVIQYSPEEIITGNVKPTPYGVSIQRWFKTRGALNDDMKLHACIIAYASDSGFINTAATANGFTYNSESIGMMTSLDHSVWFHAPARADKWLLYDIHSPRTNNGRGVAFGRIYSQDGVLVATTAQEGIVRLSALEQKRQKKQAETQQQLAFDNGNNSHL
ncbi:hypothetical protein [Parasitella parasitica]|uniref:Acyl-CoA thioesterase II domain-containing protein n=1 Tax=Parasitella parasitica TaxID=35722 RepID=A0A0B7N298_9FUNG|nr:hypothetical protein [Parasitella parasitica]